MNKNVVISSLNDFNFKFGLFELKSFISVMRCGIVGSGTNQMTSLRMLVLVHS